MSRTSNAVKDRWNAKNYDSFTVRFKKGEKAAFQAAAEASGLSLNAFIISSLEERIARAKTPPTT